MGNIYDHAQRELRLAGLLDEDSDYGGMLGKAVLDLVETFEGSGHSGYSAAVTIDLFSRVAAYQVLSPLTDDPEDWIEVGEGLSQNRRDSAAFSTDGGRTYRRNGEDVTRVSEPRR